MHSLFQKFVKIALKQLGNRESGCKEFWWHSEVAERKILSPHLALFLASPRKELCATIISVNRLKVLRDELNKDNQFVSVLPITRARGND